MVSGVGFRESDGAPTPAGRETGFVDGRCDPAATGRLSLQLAYLELTRPESFATGSIEKFLSGQAPVAGEAKRFGYCEAGMLESSKIAVPLRWRPMQPADVDACVAIVAAHPVIGPRYGADIAKLGRGWRRLLGSAAVTHAVAERLDQKRARIVGFGFAVFVRDEFIHEIKTPPLVWVGPELTRRVTGRASPVLTDDEVRDANSGAGLSEVVWEGTATPEFAQTIDFYHHMVAAYVEVHRGSC